MTPKIAQVASKRLQKLSGGKHVEPTCSQGRFRNVPGHHFGRFWMAFELILDGFGMNFGWILASMLKAFCLYSAATFAECNHAWHETH